MEQSLDKKPELKEILLTFLNKNKKKLFIIIFIIIAMTIAFFLWKDNQNKKNIIISEKYTKAQLLFLKNEKDTTNRKITRISRY